MKKLAPAEVPPPFGFELNSRTRVMILGGYGVRNVGDEAILAGLLPQLDGAGSVTVVSRNPNETKALHGVNAVSPAAALLALLRCDALIVGGGGLFSSDTGPLGRLIPKFCRIAMMRGLPVAFHGVGVYSSASPGLMKEIAQLAIRLTSFTVRDSASVRTLAAIGVESEGVPDLSASMPAAGQDLVRAVLDEAGLETGRPIVGLCLSSINERVARYLQLAVPQLCEALPELQFCFIPMSQHPTNVRHNDAAFGLWLKERAPRLRIVAGEHHPSVVLGLFSQLAAAVCVRYHSLLFANRAGVPIVGVPYSEKCQSWLDDHGQQSLDLDHELLTSAVVEAIEQGKAQGYIRTTTA